MPTIVHILDGNSEIAAYEMSDLCYSISLMHLRRTRAVKNFNFSPKRPVYLHAGATFSELPFNIGTMMPTCKYPKITTKQKIAFCG